MKSAIVFGLALMVGGTAAARTDVKAKQQQLSENLSASKSILSSMRQT
ncbi:MAG: hypothetical protein IPJ84_12275 [Bdellovibrionales bacterium]|nr:hypothetical protein [Bdellovibrionales bacterium]